MSNRIDTARTLLRRVVGLARTALGRDDAPPGRPPRAPAGPDAPGSGAGAVPARGPALDPGHGAGTGAAQPGGADTRGAPAPELNEPIQTLTMARLLASQGHHQRAVGIYEKLIALRPDDPALQEETARAREAARETAPPGAPDVIVSLPVEDGGVLLSWEVSEAGIQRAQRLLPHAGTLTARLVIVAPDSEEVIRSRTSERSVQKSGEWLLEPLPSGARATASVGLLAGERFVSIAHAPTLRA